MKLTKDHYQRIFLGIFIVTTFCYSYFEFLLGPLQKQREMTERSMVTIDQQISIAKGHIAKAKAIEEREVAARALVAQVNTMIPEGSPVAWFPPRMTEFMRKQGIDRLSIRMNNEVTEKKLVGFRKLNWAFDVTRADFIALATAIAALENEEPLMEIQSMEIEAGRDDVGTQHAVFMLNNIVRL